MTVKEKLEAELAALQAKYEAELRDMRAKIDALPTEVHSLTVEAWDKVKAFFGI